MHPQKKVGESPSHEVHLYKLIKSVTKLSQFQEIHDKNDNISHLLTQDTIIKICLVIFTKAQHS